MDREVRPEMSFSWPAGFSLSVASDPAQQVIEIFLEQEDNVDANSTEFWEENLASFAFVVNHGGLSGASLDPQSSRWETCGSTHMGTRALSFSARVSAVDPGAWRVLLNHFTASSEASFALSKLIIRGSEQRGTMLDIVEARRHSYPTHHKNLPFTVERAEMPTFQNHLVQIEFYVPLADGRSEDCIRAIRAWDILNLGGYPDEDEPPLSNANDATEVYLVAPNTIEHPIPNYLGSDFAFDSIIAMAHWFHLTGSQVLAVRIE